MNRDEEIWNAISELKLGTYNEDNPLDHDTYSGDDVQNAFYLGAKWADSHTESPWISIDESLPCNHDELIENENYTKKVLVVLAWNDNPSKKHIEICNMCNKIGPFNTNWYWLNTAYYHVVYWKPLPELPEE